MLSQATSNAAAALEVIPALAEVQGVLSTGQAAKALGMSRSTIVKLILGGQLAALRTSPGLTAHYRISADALKAYVSRASVCRL
jgi:excisionase family DNA binding protein